MKTKKLLTMAVLLPFMFLTTNTYADLAPDPDEVGGLSMFLIGITVAAIALIAFFIIRYLRKNELKA
jgi:hypothetical protein